MQGVSRHPRRRQRLPLLLLCRRCLLRFRRTRRGRMSNTLSSLVGSSTSTLNTAKATFISAVIGTAPYWPSPGNRRTGGLRQRVELEDGVLVVPVQGGQLVSLIGVKPPEHVPQADDPLRRASQTQAATAAAPCFMILKNLAKDLESWSSSNFCLKVGDWLTFAAAWRCRARPRSWTWSGQQKCRKQSRRPCRPGGSRTNPATSCAPRGGS